MRSIEVMLAAPSSPGLAQHDARGYLLHGRAIGVAREGRLLDALDGVLAGAGARALRALAATDGELDILDLRVEVELHAGGLEVLDERQDHRLVLVVAGEAQSGEVRQPRHMVDEALEVELHLERGVPVLEGEHGAPVHPEVGGEHLIVEVIGDGAVVELLVGREDELHDLHRGLVREAELAVAAGVVPAVLCGAAERVVGVFLVEPVVLVQDGDAGCLDGGDGAEQVPHHLEVVVHLAAAAHDVAEAGDVPAVAGAAGHVVLLEDVDVLARHLGVAHEIGRGGECRQTRAHDVGALMVDARGLLGAGEGFVVSA